MATAEQRDRDERAGSGAVRFALTLRQRVGQAPARVLAFGALLVLGRFVLDAGAVLAGESPLFPAWFLVLLATYCLAVALWVVLTGHAHAVLEPGGVWREGARESAFVPWSDVVAVKQLRLLDARWVSLRRRDGRRLWLPAPATSLFGPDQEFREKVETVRHWWTAYGELPGRVSRRTRWRRRLPFLVVVVFALGWFVVQVLRYDIQPGREVVRELPDSCAVLDGATAVRAVRDLQPRHERTRDSGADVDRCGWGTADPAQDGTRLAVELRRYERDGADSGPQRAADELSAYEGERLSGDEFAELTDIADEAVIQIGDDGSSWQATLHVRRVNVVLDVQVAGAGQSEEQARRWAVDVARSLLAWVEVGS